VGESVPRRAAYVQQWTGTSGHETGLADTSGQAEQVATEVNYRRSESVSAAL